MAIGSLNVAELKSIQLTAYQHYKYKTFIRVE